ncbi:AAA family ATPase [Sphingomonas oligophenolica]|uniref:AAA family ATPase n=1 Tax=Sphingomonas oligophenolica TaxID=301154 RepID=A0ABU9Y9F6_9SPHN
MQQPRDSHPDDQAALIACLASGACFGSAGACRRIDTHAATIFLSEDRAWKLKRAVRYPYLDFSTPEKRRAALEAELRLNRRTAPELYLAVHAVARAGNSFTVTDAATSGDAGDIVDWVLEMKRFPDNALLDDLAKQGPLDPSLLLRLADHVHAFHDRAGRAAEANGADRFRQILDGNADSLAPHAALFGGDRIARLLRDQRRTCERHAALLDARGREGRIRHVHGDLHLANIALIDGEPTPFDCLEFSEELATTDILYDLAFLLMDLWHRDLRAGANLVFNRYIDLSADEEGVRLLPLFLSVRATIRAHVLAATGARTGNAAAGEQANGFLDLAERLIAAARPTLIAVGGLSGTGKSALARALGAGVGAAPGARILRSDVLRKRLAGVSPEQRLSSALYTPLASRTVYSLLSDLTGRHLSADTSVIADAVFAASDERAAIARDAAHAHVPFFGLWLDAAEAIRLERVGQRVTDASDADAGVVLAQSRYATGPLGEWHRLRADQPLAGVVADAGAIIAGTGARGDS